MVQVLLGFKRSQVVSPRVLWLAVGGYDMEEKAARAYDLAALKYWGTSTHINFPVICLNTINA
jgi:hypothetical protein